jgi:hypothetical protein
MCQKGCQVFKQFYVVILRSDISTRSLQVLKTPPTENQITHIIANHVIGKVEPVPHLYAERPKIEVVPIQIPYDILFH